MARWMWWGEMGWLKATWCGVVVVAATAAGHRSGALAGGGLDGSPWAATGGPATVLDDGATNTPLAGSLVWYGDETAAGGKGDWATLNVNWFNGTALQAWDSTRTAVFDTFGGEVTIGPAGIAAGSGLAFQAGGYTLLGGTLTLSGGSREANTITVADGLAATIAGPIAGSAGLTKADGGTLAITADSSLAGGIAVTGGTIQFGEGGTSGGLAGDVELAAGSMLAINRSNALTVTGVITGAGGLRKDGEGVLNLTGANTFTGGTAVAMGTVVVGDGATAGQIAAGGAIEIASGAVLAFARGDSVEFTGSIAGPGTVEQRGGGTLVLSRPSAYGADFTLAVTDGTVDLNRGGGSLLDMLAAGNSVNLAGGTLQLTGSGGSETRFREARIEVQASSTLAIARAGTSAADHATADFAAPLTVANGAALTFDFRGQIAAGFTGTTTYTRPVTLDSDATFAVVNSAGGAAEVIFAGAVNDGGAGYGLTKAGPERLTLAAANTFSGDTTVSAGTLEVANADALASSAVTVAGGATLEVASGTTMKTPGVTLDGGTLAADSLAVEPTAGIATLVINSGTVAATSALVVGPGGLVGLPVDTRVTPGVASLAVDETATGGLVDLGSGELAVAAGGILAADLRADILAGRNGGTWDGTAGITSSSAAASGGTRAVGYTVAGDGSARVSFAAPGDTNLDGVVDLIDLLAILSSNTYDQPVSSVWQQGDFNYDGVTDLLDLLAILGSGTYDQGNYFPAGPATLGGLDGLAGPGTVAAVPEPGAHQMLMIAAVTGIAGLGFARRRSAV